MKFIIKELCRRNNITQKMLANMIGMSEVGLSQSINGNPTISTLEKVANALNVPITDLFEKQEQQTQESDIIICPHCNGKIKIKKG